MIQTSKFMKFICHLKISIHIIKLKIKNKGKNKRAARKKNLIQRNPQRLSTDFSAKILKARAEWDDTFKILKKKKKTTATKNTLLSKIAIQK